MSEDKRETNTGDIDDLDVERDDDEGPDEPQPWAKLSSGEADEA